MKQQAMKVQVTIEKVFFFKNDYMIASTKEKGVVQGSIHHKPIELEGEKLELSGSYEDHQTHGKSFHFTHYTVMGNYDLFFLTKVVSGINKRAAHEILNKCGNRLEEIIEKHPKILLSVKGIGEKKLASIVQSFKENKPLKELSELLLPFGITVNKIKKIHEFYVNKSVDAVNEIKKNPYILTRMDGIGFKRADDIALRMGQEVDSCFRIQHGIMYAIEKHCGEHGHTYARSDGLYDLAKDILDIEKDPSSSLSYEQSGFILEYDRFKLELDMLRESKKVQNIDESGERISLPHLIAAEKYILKTLQTYALSNRGDISKDIEKYITQAEKKNGFLFGSKQKDAIRLANKQYPIFFVYGLAGSGKTTISRVILNLYSSFLEESQVICTSLSGVAANRAATVTGYRGMTIHSLLSYKGKEGFEYNENKKLPYRMILLDEASMVDAWLFSSLMKAIDFESTTLMIVGDPAQLPSVGSGDIYRDIIEKSENAPYLCKGVGLDEVFRQSSDQVINIFATDYIRKGLVPENYKANWADFAFVPVEIENSWAVKNRSSDAEWKEIKKQNNLKIVDAVCHIAMQYRHIQKLYTEDIKKYISAFQVITPQKQRELGVYALNNKIQEILNPTDFKDTLYLEDKKIKRRDKVIHLSNIDKKCCTTKEWRDHQKDIGHFVKHGDIKEKRIYNGMIGVVIAIDLQSDTISVYYPNEEIVTFYKKDDFESGQIDLSYAITVHKSQGSQYNVAVAVYTTSHYMMHTNQLTYTTITRPEDKFYAVGESFAFEKGCKEMQETKRDTYLSLIS